MTKSDPTDLAAQLGNEKKPPPVENWNPSLSGDMDMRIARDGTWYHEGRAIQRESLVRLFSTILRRDEDGFYYLLTPVEKWRIQVDDAPFLAVLLEVESTGEEQYLRFQTNVGDTVIAGSEHPLRVDYREAGGEPAPYVHVRGRLEALLSRSVFLELAELAEERDVGGERVYGVWSQGKLFRLGLVEN